MPSNFKDGNIMAICKELNVKIPEDAHLITLIHEFLLFKEMTLKSKNWKFRQGENNKYYWVN